MVNPISLEQFRKLKEKLAKEKRLEAKIVSDSMIPLIQVGKPIHILPVNSESIKLFDIIVYWSDFKLICHYVHHINTDCEGDAPFITKGLNTRWEDFPVRKDQILGRVENVKIGPLRKLMIAWKHRITMPH